ncbi:MAG: hypothetical protein XD74_1534 [Actinobacteria bacterium 66_15]|nr:MAG: hypothetical protein XD74_1534 [Actinobacteria bacterium 66_15]
MNAAPRRTRPSRKTSPRSARAVSPRLIAGLAAVVVALGVVGFGVTRLLNSTPDVSSVEPGQPVHVVIESGSTTAQIARQLADHGVVENALMFRYHASTAGADGQLRAGEYDLTTGMDYDDVIDLLLVGPSLEYVNVTVPEGFTAEQVAERMAAQAGVSAEEMTRLCTEGAPEFVAERPYLEGAFGDSLEGFLFPATYSIEIGTSEREIVDMMLDTFEDQVATLDLSYAESQGLDLVDVVVIASILEREAQLPEEFPLVSSVIYNRLDQPMRLQLCATVMYTMPDGTTSLTNADLEQDTPYNTYLRDGLPPGPISNPGLAALEAAADPADTDYLYYVLTGTDGSQTFTETYDEFLAAKRLSQEVFSD